MKIRMTLGFTILLLVMIFTLQNAEVVTIRFLFWSFSLSRALMLFLVFASGSFIGWFGSSMVRHLSRKSP